MLYCFCDTVAVHVGHINQILNIAELIERSYGKTVSPIAIVSEPTYLDTLRRRITLYASCHQ